MQVQREKKKRKRNVTWCVSQEPRERKGRHGTQSTTTQNIKHKRNSHVYRQWTATIHTLYTTSLRSAPHILPWRPAVRHRWYILEFHLSPASLPLDLAILTWSTHLSSTGHNHHLLPCYYPHPLHRHRSACILLLPPSLLSRLHSHNHPLSPLHREIYVMTTTTWEASAREALRASTCTFSKTNRRRCWPTDSNESWRICVTIM